MYYTSARLVMRNKKWRGFLSYKDTNGKYRQVSKTLEAKTKTEAKRELSTWHQEMERAHEAELSDTLPHAATAQMKVADYVDQYIDSLEARQAIEASSVKGYRASAKFIREEFSRVTVSSLKPIQVERWETKLIQRGLSSSTVGKAHRLLKQVMKNAVNCRLITYNPLDPVKPPKRKNKKPGINALDINARTELLTKLADLELVPVSVAATIALYTGLRRGEICALRWQDVDLKAGTIWIRQSLGEGPGGFYLKLSKTDKKRDVVLPPTATRILAQWKAKLGIKADSENGLYVLTGQETYFNPHALSAEWTSLSKAFGIRGTEGRLPTFHDLRHTWATMYLAAGGDVKTAASNLGHANAAMTLNVYASADPNAKREAARLTEVAMVIGQKDDYFINLGNPPTFCVDKPRYD